MTKVLGFSRLFEFSEEFTACEKMLPKERLGLILYAFYEVSRCGISGSSGTVRLFVP